MTLPLGLRLEHDATRTGFLGARDVRVGDALALERLRLALPGAWTLQTATRERLAPHRTALAELGATFGESALNARLAALVETRPPLPGLRGVELRMQPGRATLLVWRTLDGGHDALVTCRVFVAPPGPGQPPDTLVLELYEPRAFGPPGDLPPALVVRDVLAALFETPELVGRVDDPLERSDPRGAAYGPQLERDRLYLRPVKRLLAELLAPLGWKLPALGPSLVCHYALEDGCLRVDCHDLELAGPVTHDLARLATPPEARLEHAGLEQARRVLRNADAALFAGQLDAALDLLRAVRRRLGHHPALLARLGYGLLARPDASGHLDELATLCAEALRHEPGLVVARLLNALLRMARDPHDAAGAAHALRELLGYLDAGSQPLDRVCALVAVARLEAASQPARAVAALREAIRLEPGLRAPLEALDAVYEQHGEHAARVELLQRLLAMTRQRERRSRLELRLARALHAAGAPPELADDALHRAAALCDPDDLDSLEALADTAATLAEPSVAIGLFGRLAELAETREAPRVAARAYLRSAELWLALGSTTNARLACHTALGADPALLPAAALLVRTSVESGDAASAIATLEALLETLERELWTTRHASHGATKHGAAQHEERAHASTPNQAPITPTPRAAFEPEGGPAGRGQVGARSAAFEQGGPGRDRGVAPRDHGGIGPAGPDRGGAPRARLDHGGIGPAGQDRGEPTRAASEHGIGPTARDRGEPARDASERGRDPLDPSRAASEQGDAGAAGRARVDPARPSSEPAGGARGGAVQPSLEQAGSAGRDRGGAVRSSFFEQGIGSGSTDGEAAPTAAASAPRAALLGAARMLAEVAAAHGDGATARRAWRRVLRHDPGDDAAFAALCATEPPQECVDLYAGRIEALRAAGQREAARDLMLELAALYEGSLGLPSDALAWLERALVLVPGELGLEERRVALLEATGRHFELRDALEGLVARVAEPRRRAELLVRLARIELDGLHDAVAAARTLQRAVALRPTARELLLELRRAQSRAAQHEALVATLERLAQLADDPRARRAFLVEAGDVYYDRLARPQPALRFYRDALALGGDAVLEHRIESILRAAREPARPTTPPPWARVASVGRSPHEPLPAPPAPGPPTDVAPALSGEHDHERLATPAAAQDAAAPVSSSGASGGGDRLPTPVSEELAVELFDEPHGMGLQLLAEESSPTPASGLHPAEAHDAPAPPEDPDAAARRWPRYRSASHGHGLDPDDIVSSLPWRAQLPDDDEHGSSDDAPSPDLDDLDDLDDLPLFVAPDPRQAPDWRVAAQAWTRRPAPPPEPRETADTARDAAGSARTPASAARDGDDTESRINAARRAGDATVLAELLEQALAGESDPARRARLHQEIGCLAFYDLDDPERACDHLELASEADPEGVALESETLTALEGIYEDLDDPARLAEVYERRLRRTERPEMRPVYHLLAAHLHHERLDDADAARRHLATVLDDDPHHEPALRLLAELDREAGRPGDAADHLARLVDALASDEAAVAGLLPELAEHLEAAGRLDEARRALLRAVRLAPEPLAAIERLKRLCRAHDDWHGLLNALIREIALQLGPRSAAGLGLEDLMALAPEAVPAERIVGICQTLREIADILSLKLDADDEAWRIYGRVLALAPDDAYALERRIELGRLLGRWTELANDLAQLAPMLLDPALQLDALAEAAAIHRERLDDRLRARELLARAVVLFRDRPGPPPARLEEVTRELERLEQAVVVRVSLGSGTGLHKVPPPRASTPAADTPRRRTPSQTGAPALELPAAPAVEAPPAASLVEPEAVDELFELDGVRRQLDELEAALARENDRDRRVELLTRKGMLLSRHPETQHEALVSLRAALALELGHVPARLALVDGLLATGEVEQALNHLIVLAQRTPAALEVGAQRAEVLKLVEIIVATGQPSVVQRARALLASLSTK